MSTIRDQIQHVAWEANKKTIRPAHKATRVSNACMQSVRELQERGAFGEAIQEMEEQLKQQPTDAGALILHALSHLGNADADAALKTLEDAWRSVQHDQNAILLNRAQAYRVKEDFDAALSVADQLFSVAVEWYATHLLLIGLHELRADRESARAALTRLRTHICKFSVEDKEELRRYLLNDTDFIALRAEKDSVFCELLHDLGHMEEEVHP